MVLRVLFLYIPLPMFWALFDQQVGEPTHLRAVLAVLWAQPCLALTARVLDVVSGFPLDHSGCQDEHGFCESYLPNAEDMA